MWDIFCNVIDNYGDIGVCWRLSRQLACEKGVQVRLWVDDLATFQPLCPQIDLSLPVQRIDGVEIRHWVEPFPVLPPGEVVIEAFGCQLSPSFLSAMAGCQVPPVWINLEYLSAEAWVHSCHTLPSPHPRLPLTKYFFFPGFTAETGGVLREKDLLAHREHFFNNASSRKAFWRELAISAPNRDTLSVSLFAYENPAIPDLLKIWAEGTRSIRCLLPESRALPLVASCCGRALQAGDLVRQGALEIVVLPFVEQSRYDPLLWACDLNFVRGEDSFVRAQWAARPMVWHIYPQEEEAHLGKLDAFLQRYCAAMPVSLRHATEAFWSGWNAGRIDEALWRAFSERLNEAEAHARQWSAQLAKQKDLSSTLVRFCRSKV